jgi:hypothetical protein
MGIANTTFANAPINAPDLNNLLATARDGWIKNCRFAVRITVPRIFFQNKQGDLTNYSAITRDLTFLCEAAESAGRAFQTVDYRYYGPSMKSPYQSVYNDMNLTFLCRAGMKEKRFFDKWHNFINPNNSYDFNYLDDYSTSIDLFQFDEGSTAKYQQTYMRAWPIIVNPTQLTWADDQISRLTVTFTYREYKTQDDPPAVPPLQTLVLGSTNVFDESLFLFTNNTGFGR